MSKGSWNKGPNIGINWHVNMTHRWAKKANKPCTPHSYNWHLNTLCFFGKD